MTKDKTTKGDFRPEEALKEYDIHGRRMAYAVQWHTPERNRQAADWFRQNPHRLQLGNIGFELVKRDGSIAVLQDIHSIHQVLNCWKGEIVSEFTLEGVPVHVSTLVHPDEDMVAVSVRSPLIREGRLHIRLRLPYPTGGWADAGDNWTREERHYSGLVLNNNTGAIVGHRLDSTRYFISMAWRGSALYRKISPHYFLVEPSSADLFSVSVRFSSKRSTKALPSYAEAAAANETAWSHFWRSGGAVDFSGSTDPRAFELERRVILSQYLTRIQCAGDYPPQETGLTYNSWYGKPHLEMHWWNGKWEVRWEGLGKLP